MGYDIILVVAIITMVIVGFSFFNEKVLKLPTEIGLMTIAFALSFSLLFTHKLGIDFIPETKSIIKLFDIHDIIMNGLICFLLFSGSAKILFSDLAEDKYLILSLAFIATLISALIYGVLVYYFANFLGINMNILEACMLGSIIAPTDPVSAMSILKKAGMKRRLALIIEGESLFNDGIAVALFVTFSQMNKTISTGSPLFIFLKTITYNVFGAILIGIIVSYPLFKIFKATKHKHIEVLTSLAALTVAYSISEHFKMSAPITAVIVGMYFATQVHELHSDYREYYTNFYSFWKVIDRSFNGFLYIIIGFAILYIKNIDHFFIIMLSAIIMAQISRYLSLIGPVFIFGRCPEHPKEFKKEEAIAMVNLLTWGGLKGGICIALALGTSKEVSQQVYQFIVISTYSVVAFSILAQGLTIKKVYSKLENILVDEKIEDENINTENINCVTDKKDDENIKNNQ